MRVGMWGCRSRGSILYNQHVQLHVSIDSITFQEIWKFVNHTKVININTRHLHLHFPFIFLFWDAKMPWWTKNTTLHRVFVAPCNWPNRCGPFRRGAFRGQRCVEVEAHPPTDGAFSCRPTNGGKAADCRCLGRTPCSYEDVCSLVVSFCPVLQIFFGLWMSYFQLLIKKMTEMPAKS